MRVLLLLFSLLLSPLLSANPFAAKADFLPVDQAFRVSHERLEDGQLRIDVQIQPGYYLYQKRLKFDGLSAEQQPVLPTPLNHHDEFFGDSPIYREHLQLLIPADAQGQLRLGWQGCADAGLCYPPQTSVIDLGGTAPGAGAQASDQALAGSLAGASLGWSLLAFFGLGLLLAFTPCSLPMLPILAGLVLGQGATPRRGWLLAGSYVLSMALVYAGLGVVAALLGGSLQAWLQQPWLLAALAGLFVLLALPMFGAFELQLPAALRDRLDRAGRGAQGGSLYGAALLGALSGLLLGPCMTAPLAGALLYIAQSGDVLQGALVLFSLGLGMGLPLLLLVTVGNRFLPRPGAWMERIKALFGFVFLGMALYIARTLLPEPLLLGLAGAWLASLAWSAWWALASHTGLRVLALLAGLWASLMMIGAAAGGSDPWQPLQPFAGTRGAAVVSTDAGFIDVRSPAALQGELDAARKAGQWVMLDYSADWCVACKVMEKNVFARADVQAALSEVRLLRLDVSADSPDSRALLQRYQVPGPPSLLWLGPDGNERRAQRITGEVDATTLLEHWSATRSQG
ncbi:protein-disulfide reductase DsbD [Pseudomonas cremoricolorata]|uniref:Thiol:disulfide interchange protein DsbD n=1 Tax=Pseudomonas cremoricolorata TaxID=157783 RepID=A0A089WQ33_9PSED|nr:protein-disulfide reductase DsbD [Pseudomonas cremoricolorata]AIR91415.1 thiol:disulfide interchange protein [Pseudomonas cremoricolorata]